MQKMNQSNLPCMSLLVLHKSQDQGFGPLQGACLHHRLSVVTSIINSLDM